MKIVKSNQLIIVISDHGKPSKSIRLEYQINIIDINDSPPIFHQLKKCYLDLNLLQNQTLNKPLFKIQAIDLDSGDNGRISYLILPPNENLFQINNQGEIISIGYLNESYYHLQIMAIDHGNTIRLNSTYDCYLSYSNKSIALIDNISIFKYNYLLVIFIFVLILIGISFCLYKFIFNHRRCYEPNKTYHLYVSIPRKSLYINDESICDNVSEEQEKLVHLNSDQSSDISDRNSFISTNFQSKQDHRPVSLAISTDFKKIHG